MPGKMNYAKRSREDVTNLCNAQDALQDAEAEYGARLVAVADYGELITLDSDDLCVVCHRRLEAGTEALWFPRTRELSHVRWQCPSRPEYRTSPNVIKLPTAGRDEMLRSAC